MALEKIGPYEFKGILGRGGMGTVYRGRHEETGEIHAVKVLAPVYAHDDHFRGRFESEIKALIKLDHPNIVQILSYGQDDAMLYFSMELVEGNSLFQLQRQHHPFNWREIISIAKDVAHGLRHAHDRGVIHRDLKPGNLLMTSGGDDAGTVKITDFGIAKRFGNSQNTGSNVLGTMDFMSPEQAKGEPVTARSDIYSLGTVLFTLLSGKPPFSSNSIEESLRNLTVVPAPSIRTFVPGVPAELDAMIAAMMQKRPEDRIPTAQALMFQIDELELALREESEAKTAHLSLPNEFPNDTFLGAQPLTQDETKVSGHGPGAAATTDSSQTIENDDSEIELEPPTPVKVDYFKNVTDKTRLASDSFAVDPPAKQGGIIPVALAFIGVISLIVFLVYRAFLPPTADELHAKIEIGYNQPQTVIEEMDLFLEHYPDDSRAEQVSELKQTAKSIHFYTALCNTLRTQGNISGGSRLTEVEKQFYAIAESADDDAARAGKQMDAFITLYESAPQLSLRDRKCVTAAKGYQTKIQHDVVSKVNFDLRQIRSAMRTAEKTTTPGGAISRYRAIIELYGNTEWGDASGSDDGREIIKKARGTLKAMEAAREQADREKAAQEKIDQNNAGQNDAEPDAEN